MEFMEFMEFVTYVVCTYTYMCMRVYMHVSSTVIIIGRA